MNKTNRQYFIGFALVLGIAAGLWWIFYSPAPAEGEYDTFARCLAGKGFTMYGADWCPHCQNEKRALGDSFRLIPYVECPQNPQACIAQGVKGYPTWIVKDGRRFEGEMGLSRLSEESGCALRSSASSTLQVGGAASSSPAKP